MSELAVQIAIGFIRNLANQCDECYRHGEACDTCIAKDAKGILANLDDKPSTIDYTLAFRCAKIEEILRRNARPTKSSDICLQGICSKQLKHWTLRMLLKSHRIQRYFDDKQKCYLYSLREQRKTKNEN